MSLWGRIKSFFGIESEAPASAPEFARPQTTQMQPRADIAMQLPTAQSQPVILISGQSPNSKSVQAAVQSVIEQGGIPRVVSTHTGRNLAQDMQGISGIMLMGNDYDTDPRDYGATEINPHTLSEKDPQLAAKAAAAKGRPLTPDELAIAQNAPARAEYETALIRETLAKKIPLLGICGGLQRVNTVLGGTLYQHIPDLTGNSSHMQTEGPSTPVQPVTLVGGGHLSELGAKIGVSHAYARTPGVHSGDIMENSFHHQAVALPGNGLRVSATYQDQVPIPGTGEKSSMIAALEVDPNGPLAGQSIQLVQWHPEFKASPLATELLKDFVGNARARAQGVQTEMEAPHITPAPIWQNRITAERAQSIATSMQSGQVSFTR